MCIMCIMWINKTKGNRKSREMSILSEINRKWQKEMSKIMLTALYTKNPHVYTLKLCINMWILWIKLLSQEVFPYFNNVSGAHSYQQISVDTIF